MFNRFLQFSEGEQYKTYADTENASRWVPGTRMEDNDGRVYRFVKIGGSNIGAGLLTQAPIPHADHDELAVAAAAAGSRDVTVTLGAEGVSKNQFEGGYLNVEDDAGEGHIYRIHSHPAATATNPVVIRLTSPLVVAFTTATTVSLVPNKFTGIIVKPSGTPTATLVGVTCRALLANTWGWVQTAGPASVLGSGTLVRGNNASAIGGAAGAVGPDTNDLNYAAGIVWEVAATTEYSVVDLKLD